MQGDQAVACIAREHEGGVSMPASAASLREIKF